MGGAEMGEGGGVRNCGIVNRVRYTAGLFFSVTMFFPGWPASRDAMNV